MAASDNDQDTMATRMMVTKMTVMAMTILTMIDDGNGSITTKKTVTK